MADPFPSNVHVSKHPLLQAKLSQLRSSTTTNAKDVSSIIHDIATILAVEALGQSLTTQQTGSAETPLGYTYTPTTIHPSTLSIVPILRSGLSMLPAVQTLLPAPVPVHHLGLYREKSTLQPVEYYNNLPYRRAGGGDEAAAAALPALAVVVDPVIATGATLSAAVETLRDWGVARVVALSVLGSADGVRRVVEEVGAGLAFELWVGGIDDRTDEKGMIVPGLGDVGDRLYMTMGK